MTRRTSPGLYLGSKKMTCRLANVPLCRDMVRPCATLRHGTNSVLGLHALWPSGMLARGNPHGAAPSAFGPIPPARADGIPRFLYPRPGGPSEDEHVSFLESQRDPNSSTIHYSVVEAAGIEPASESLRQRRLHAYPGCGGNPRPKAPFPVSAPRRINPANRAVGPIPESHRRLGRTAGQARLVDVLSRPAGVVRKDVA